MKAITLKTFSGRYRPSIEFEGIGGFILSGDAPTHQKALFMANSFLGSHTESEVWDIYKLSRGNI